MEALGLLGLLWLLFNGGRTRGDRRGAPQLPSGTEPGIQTSWPQVVPAGLPAFPGSGWQYDEPPPAPVVQRARELVDRLWATGAGSHAIEQTAGRWIAYRAERVRSGKNGVVAYRLKTAGAAAPAAPAANPKPKPKPPTTAAQSTPAVPVSNAISVPDLLNTVLQQLQTADGDGVQVKTGHSYRWTSEVKGFSSAAPIVDQLAKMGAYDVKVTPGVPLGVAFTMRALRDQRVALHTWTGLVFAGVTYSIRFTDIVEVLPVGTPVSYELPPGSRALPTLRRGAGIKPQPPNEDVKLLQRKLGIAADGQFGGGTEAALRAYQQKQVAAGRAGWTTADIDGVCGPRTWTALLEVRA